MTIKPWKVLESSYIRPKFRIDRCELANGGHLNALTMEFQSWANVLALTGDGNAVLVRQYRHGAKEVLLELPGGVVEEDESPLEGVKRELLEETGYAASRILEAGWIYPNPAIQTNKLYCFLALDVEKVSVQHLDDGEDIEVQLLPLDKLVSMARGGEFLHALNVAVLFRALACMDGFE